MTDDSDLTEGWRLAHAYLTDNPGPEGYEVRIERTDEPEDGSEPKFADDKAAWAHVVAQARSGSIYHRQALEACSTKEQGYILAAVGTWDLSETR